jgi:hypothetical protein
MTPRNASTAKLFRPQKATAGVQLGHENIFSSGRREIEDVGRACAWVRIEILGSKKGSG